ncbi:hypothetical protein SPI_00255 [Niveomyces insectorum RCEF 264]|uniref:Calcofluor white hypersensitive protein n=1 Tax=Niveomyces insectorum RCEF 264 TaxID=1081102 RepID=A0A167ZZ83_9HYPO|nr:hypothetical protein SPI_00255 [Niveomyces insectorum RCEF 264]
MSRSRMPLYLSLALAGGAGYYLYSAGGSPKGAEKNFEHDLKTVRDRATSSGQRAQTEAEKFGAEARNEYDRAAANARAAGNNATKAAEDLGKDVQARVNHSVDTFDKKVEDAASKTKSGVSSWFGGK